MFDGEFRDAFKVGPRGAGPGGIRREIDENDPGPWRDDGGDGFTTFAQGTSRLGGDLDIDAFRAYLTSGTVTPDTTERIKRLN